MTFDATVQRIPSTLVSTDRLRLLWDTVQHCLPLGGDLLEVGVYKGGTAILLREAAPDRALYLYDTFAGHPYSDATRDDVNHYPGRFADTSEEAVRALFTDHPNPPIITAGVFPASAPVIPPLCFAHVDVDLYQATREACEAIWPALVLGGQLVCDDYGGYKASFALGVTEIGCMAHARRKFYELHATKKSFLAEQALQFIAAIYEVEREVRDLQPDERRRIRQEKAAPLMEALHAWMIAQRELVFEGLVITKALDYSLKRWTALSRYLNDGMLPIDNNHIEQQIRPWALGRKNWLFAGSLRSGKRAAALMSLIQSAKLNGHDAYAYLKDVLTRLPTQRASDIQELLPHRWQPV